MTLGPFMGVLSSSGGIAPRDRCRRPGLLTLAEREEISRSLAASCSVRSIAKRLGRAPSTIGREVTRNGGAKHYRATSDEVCVWERARRPKPCKLATNKQLQELVADRLA
jgi:IS30 family transposase